MNIRFDSDSIRIRITHEEAILLMKSESIRETYPMAGLSLELKISSNHSLNLEVLKSGNFRLLLPTADLQELLEKTKQPYLKKDELSIRDSIESAHSPVDLIFEIDCFKRAIPVS